MSYGSYKVVTAAEKAFKLNVINPNEKYTNTRHLIHKLSNDVAPILNCSVYFPLTYHSFQVSVEFEEDHLAQIQAIFISNSFISNFRLKLARN